PRVSIPLPSLLTPASSASLAAPAIRRRVSSPSAAAVASLPLAPGSGAAPSGRGSPPSGGLPLSSSADGTLHHDTKEMSAPGDPAAEPAPASSRGSAHTRQRLPPGTASRAERIERSARDVLDRARRAIADVNAARHLDAENPPPADHLRSEACS